MSPHFNTANMVDDATVATSSQAPHQQVNMALPVVRPAYLLSILHACCQSRIPVVNPARLLSILHTLSQSCMRVVNPARLLSILQTCLGHILSHTPLLCMSVTV